MSSWAERWRVLAICLSLSACHRVIEISAVDGRDDLEADADAGEEPDADDGGEGELADTSTETLDASADANDGGGPEPNNPIDAGGRPHMDAGRADAGSLSDAGGDGARPPSDAATDAMLPRCSGTRSLDLCWYLGDAGASCDQTCTGKGGFDSRAITRLGTSAQGGSLDACAQVLAALGYTGMVTPGYRSDGVGLGCHLWESDGWWLQSMPDWSPTASIPVASIVCACLR